MATTADGKITIDVLVTQDKFDEAMKDLSGKLSEIIKNTSKEVEEEAKKTKKTFQESMEDIKKFGAELTDVGKQFQNWFGWAVKGVQDTTKAAMDWETAFTGVRKTVDATEEEFLQLQENIRGMSMEIPVDTTNLANMMEIAGQLGITGVDNLTKFTEVAAKMGVTTNLFGEEAATAFARIFNIMGEDFGNVDRMGSAIVDLGNNFATTEQEITEFTTRIAGAGKVAGLKTADILGIATAFSSIGVTAEAGGTAVQKVLFSMTEAANGATGGIVNNTAAIAKDNQKLVELQSQLAIATQQQKEFTDKTAESTRMRNQANIDKYTSEIAALTGEIATLEATNGQAVVSQDKFAKVLGMTNKEFQDLMKENPAEVFEKFVTALGDAGGEAMSILDDLDLSDSRLKRGFVGLAQNSDLLVSAINRSNKAWEKNTALNEEAAKRFATTESKLQVLKNKFHDMAITIGDELKKKLDGLLDAIEPIVKKISNFVTEHPKLIADILEIGTVIAGVGTAMTVLGGIISGIATLLGSWVGIIAAAVTAIVAARVIWEENLFGFRDMVTDATLAIENFLRKLLGIEPLSKEQIEQRRREAKAYAELRTEIQKNIDKIDELHEKAAKNITQKEDEIKVAKKYIDRLKEITTEDGHVVEGYEDEAEQIALLINEIIPGAVELRGDEKESIIKVTDALDDLIEKMRIEAYAEAYHDEYVEQLKQYQENLVNAGKLVEKVDKKQQNLDESIKDMNKLGKLMDNTMGLIALNPFFCLTLL